MPETYAFLASFAQTFGMVAFLVGFTVTVIYALNPKRKKQFDAAANMPLQED